MTQIRPPAALSPEERERVLEILSFGAGTEGIETLIALLLLPNHGNSDARAKAARRTRLYKVRQILKRAPSSDNVMAACGYLVLDSLTRAVGRAEIRDRLLSLLVEAGFDRGQSDAVVDRLIDGVKDRQEAWRVRVKQQRAVRLAAAIKETGSVGPTR